MNLIRKKGRHRFTLPSKTLVNIFGIGKHIQQKTPSTIQHQSSPKSKGTGTNMCLARRHLPVVIRGNGQTCTVRKTNQNVLIEIQNY